MGSMKPMEPTLTTILHLNVHTADDIGLFTNLVKLLRQIDGQQTITIENPCKVNDHYQSK